MNTPTQDAYVSRIRNARKREYARAYLAWLGTDGPEPESAGLSYMAAQGVRLALTYGA